MIESDQAVQEMAGVSGELERLARSWASYQETMPIPVLPYRGHAIRTDGPNGKHSPLRCFPPDTQTAGLHPVRGWKSGCPGLGDMGIGEGNRYRNSLMPIVRHSRDFPSA